MAITEIGSAATGTNGTTDMAITHGLTIASGDVLVACISNDDYTLTQTDNNGETPFTSPYNFLVQSTASKGYIWVRVAGSSEPDTYHWTLGGIPSFSIVLRQFRGVDTNTVWDVTPSADTTGNGTSTTAEAPSISITNEGAMGILALFVDSSSITISNVTNSYGTEVYDAHRVLATYIRASLSTGAVGAAGGTLSLSDDWAAVHFALKPAGVAPPEFTGIRVTRHIGA